MARRRDVAGILSLVMVGMFVPFSGAVLVIFQAGAPEVLLGFCLFLVFFGLEMGSVYLYFLVSGRRAAGQVEKLRPKT
jgi:hypothetical protein